MVGIIIFLIIAFIVILMLATNIRIVPQAEAFVIELSLIHI